MRGVYMKRILCLLLSCLLLLSLFGCGTPAEEPAAEPPATEPSTEPVAVTEPESAVFSLRTLPEIGAYVSDEKKAYFFEDGAHETFESQENYGEILPYPGHTSVYREVPSYTYTWDDGSSTTEKVEHRDLSYGYGIGLMTRDGKIISAPVYDYFDFAEDRSGKKIWILQTDSTKEMYTYAPTVIAGDGSWKLDFPEGYNIEAKTDSAYSYFTVSEYEESGQIEKQVYSFDGVLLADLDKIRAKYETKDKKLTLMDVEDDRLLFRFDDPQEEDDAYYGDYADYEDDEVVSEDVSYFYTNFAGKKVSDLVLSTPYDEKCGNCIVGYNGLNSTVQLFRADGTPLTDACYGCCHCDQNKQLILIGNRENDLVRVFDADGNELHRYKMNWNFFDYGKNGAVFMDQKNHKLYRIEDGSEIDLHLPDIEILASVNEQLRYNESGSLYIVAIPADGDCCIYDLDGTPVATIHKPDVTQDDYDFGDDRLYYEMDLYITDRYVISFSKADGWYIFDLATQKERKLPLTGIDTRWDSENKDTPYASLTFFGKLMVASFGYVDDDMGERSYTDLYDLETGRVLYSNLQYYDQTADQYLFTTKRTAVMLEKDGSVLLKTNSDTLF